MTRRLHSTRRVIPFFFFSFFLINVFPEWLLFLDINLPLSFVCLVALSSLVFN